MSTREELPNEPKNVFRAGRGDSPSLRTVELREPCRTRPNGANCKVVTTQADMLPKCPRACRTPSMCIGSAGACTTPEHKQPRQRSGESPWSAFRCNWGACRVHAHAAGCNWGAAKCRSASCAKPTRPSRITTGSPALTVGLNEASKRLQHLRSTWPSCKALFQLQLLPNCAAQFAQFAKCKITLCQPETRAWSCLEACSQQSSARTSTPNLKFSKVSHIGSTNKVVASQPERTVRAVRAVRPCAATVSRHDRL